MNILFLTLVNFSNIDDRGIYNDLVRVFLRNGHSVDVVCPAEGATTTRLTDYGNGGRILAVAMGSVQKASILKKGINTVLLEPKLKYAMNNYLSDKRYDLILYSTPPITLAGVVKYIKKRDNAKTYLLLKDIFPQNAVDLGMMSKRGIKAPIYWYFRRKEKQLYALSDRIGCMSQANVDYVIAHNPEVNPGIVEICPNSIEVVDKRITEEERRQIREKYGIPQDKTVFIYGGNLGKPQGILFIIECLKSQKNNPDAFFLIVGSGTEFGKLQAWFDEAKPANMKLMQSLPKEDYDCMVAACDVGMIFLDHRFTIPNFPSRLLSYMQAGLPVLCCTDPNTDIGKIVVDGGFGWWCESNDVGVFKEIAEKICTVDRTIMKESAIAYLNENYSAVQSFRTIIKILEIQIVIET